MVLELSHGVSLRMAERAIAKGTDATPQINQPPVAYFKALPPQIRELPGGARVGMKPTVDTRDVFPIVDERCRTLLSVKDRLYVQRVVLNLRGPFS